MCVFKSPTRAVTGQSWEGRADAVLGLWPGNCPGESDMSTPRTVDHVSRPLVIAGCRSLCGWRDTGQRLDGERLFACTGCGSEWVASQPWTPIDSSGSVPQPVQDEVRESRRTRGRG